MKSINNVNRVISFSARLSRSRLFLGSRLFARSRLSTRSRLLPTLVLSSLLGGCAGVQVAEDGPLIRPSEPAQDIQIEQTSADIICVTVDGERTCVPVVHD